MGESYIPDTIDPACGRGRMMRAVSQIEDLDSVIGKVVFIPVEHLAG